MDLSKLDMALTIIDKELSKAFFMTHNTGKIILTSEKTSFTGGKYKLTNVPKECFVFLSNGKSGDLFECLEAKISDEEPEERTHLLFYVAKNQHGSLKKSESSIIASAILGIIDARRKSSHRENLSFTCGAGRSRICELLAEQIAGLYTKEELRDFVSYAVKCADAGIYIYRARKKFLKK